jgi:hypothetical protein
LIREGTIDDIERIESLTLDDFAMEFPPITSPPGEGPMSDEEMKTRVDAFRSSLERDRESLNGR